MTEGNDEDVRARATDRAAMLAAGAPDGPPDHTSRTARLRAALEDERDRVARTLDRLDAESAEHRARVGTRDPCAWNSPSVAEEEDRQARLTAMAARAERALHEIDDALHRLTVDPASYGTCEVCGRRIEEERLALLPTSRQCAGCAG